MSSESDTELVARFRAGDVPAFGVLADRHRPWIHRVCARFLRSDEAARDATQDVFARALEHLDTFRGANFPGWLKAIAVNTCLNVIDREKRWAPLADADAVAARSTAADVQLLRDERTAQARRVIERLPPKQKIVFCMKYIDGCSYAEIERLTGFSPNEVKSFLQNGRRNFENWWRAEEERAGWQRTI